MQCCASIYAPGMFRRVRCSKPATVAVGGKGYCALHCPKATEQRRAARSARAASQAEANRYQSAMLQWMADCAKLVESMVTADEYIRQRHLLLERKPKKPEA